MLMQIALQGTVKDPPVDAVAPENPEAMNQVAPATVYPASIGSSKEYSTLKVAAPLVIAAPIPTLNGFKKLSTAMAALRPVPVLVTEIGVIAYFL
jgi:hypothetical protein